MEKKVEKLNDEIKTNELKIMHFFATQTWKDDEGDKLISCNFQKRKEVTKLRKSIKVLTDWLEVKRIDMEKEKLEKFTSAKKELEELNNKILEGDLDKAQFLREASLHSREDQSNELIGEDGNLVQTNEIKFYESMAEQFKQGQSLEIIDGDLGTLDQESLARIMDFVQLKKANNSSLVVITVLGPQSTGKSTLLNHIFGAKFHVSDGRCTKGLNAMLVKTDIKDAEEVLILHSEGLFSIEKNNRKNDRNMVIFCFAISNFVLINMRGELDTSV